MVRLSKLLTSVLFVSLALIALSCSEIEPALATKIKMKTLPRNGDPNGRAAYSRQTKDFSSANQAGEMGNSDNDGPLPITRWKRRPDYRDVERQKKEEEEQKAKDALQAKQDQENQKKEYYLKQTELAKKRRDEAINYNNQGVLTGQQGRWSEAITNHEKAVEYDPYDKQFRINLSAARTAFGEKKIKEGDVSSAASLFRKALAAQQDNATAAKGLAKALEKLGFDPVDPEVRMNIGDQLVAVNDFEGAYIEYLQAMQIDPSAKANVKVGDMEYRYRRVAQAQYYYQQAIIKDQNYCPAHRQLGLLKLALRDETGAAALLRKAVILDPSDAAAGQALVDLWRAQAAKNPLNPDYHLGLAGALQLTGDFVGAESEYKKLELVNANYPGLAEGRATLVKAYQHARADKHMKAAETLFSQGLRNEALSEISQAVIIEERNSHYQFLLGECLEAIGDYAGAHRAYLTCVLIDPNNVEAAARMKEMQSYAQSSPQPVNTGMARPLLPMAIQGEGGGMPGQPVNMPGQSRSGMAPGVLSPGPGTVPNSVMPGQQSMMRIMPMQNNNMQMQMQPTQQNRMTYPHSMNPNLLAEPMGKQKRGTSWSGSNTIVGVPKNMFEAGPGLQPSAENARAPMAFNPPSGFGMNKQVPSQNQMVSQTYGQQMQPPANAAGQAMMSAPASTCNFPGTPCDSTIYGGSSSNDNLNVGSTITSMQAGAWQTAINQAENARATQDPRLNEVSQAEARHDYTTAVNLLKEVVDGDLENAEIHHRLAINLMGAERITEAVTEFRIASALKPMVKNYADDLARALEIHKRSLTSSNFATKTHDGSAIQAQDAVGGGNP